MKTTKNINYTQRTYSRLIPRIQTRVLRKLNCIGSQEFLRVSFSACSEPNPRSKQECLPSKINKIILCTYAFKNN